MNSETGHRHLLMKMIDDFEKEESVKVRITGADLPDSVLAHENGSVGIVQEISRKVRYLPDDRSVYSRSHDALMIIYYASDVKSSGCLL